MKNLFLSHPSRLLLFRGNEQVKKLAQHLQDNDLDVRPILYPTVPKGRERLRIVLHAFITDEENRSIDHLFEMTGNE